MKCPKCQSENVKVELKNNKSNNIGGLCVGGLLLAVGQYLMFGFYGGLIVFFIFLVLLAIISCVGIASPSEITVGICQNCGEVFNTKTNEKIDL